MVRQGANGPGSIRAVQIGHLHVHQDQCAGIASGQFKGLLTIFSDIGDEAGFCEKGKRRAYRPGHFEGSTHSPINIPATTGNAGL